MPGQPDPNEKDLRHREVVQHERDPRVHVGIVTFFKPELHRAGHAISYHASGDGCAKKRESRPSGLVKEKPAGGRQRLDGGRHRLHEPQETHHVQDLQEAEEVTRVQFRDCSKRCICTPLLQWKSQLFV